MSQTTTHRKRKHPDNVVSDTPAKKMKHSTTPKKDKKGKGKETEFKVVKSFLVVSIPPVFSLNPREGVGEMLDSMIMRYIPAFEGVVLSHSNLVFSEKNAAIKADCPFMVCKVSFDATVWRPRVGMKLEGKINLCSPDHISLLVHKTFNVSIPRHHIPTDSYVFEYGPAENDPEYGAGAQDIEGEAGKTEESGGGGGGGRWIHHLTSSTLGAPDGTLEFTVIGLTIANEMLSLLGSLQKDPFSPLHVPATKNSETSDAENAEKVDTELRALTPVGNEEEQGVISDEDEDTFKTLGRKADEAKKKAEEAREREKDKEKEKKKKKKRKERDDADKDAVPAKKKKGSKK
ncbi:dna-directed rna polymerase i complex subunit rpa43 [Moniliophthora roreri MCA 2997]|uniref:Dna-directed rna polymerase i complex subunit rpa43 n=2 Tax=Moniliophthora roreri TaxID=221103 RepID=V2X7I9_MONRO|nr:dna-directed rna polymerase i complex subunit rpa43 [Moniliophthora roreri MCA 2997]KAI3619624.1 dna-directed rna polymerase i complex subunit rpa43 [Moniliophthora roreri]